MSDSRFTLKGTFSIYGKTFPFDMWLNWFTDEDIGIDRRIVDWFKSMHDEAYYDYYFEARQDERRKELAQKEINERKLFEELNKKYGKEGK